MNADELKKAEEIVRALRNCGGGPEGMKIAHGAADLIDSLTTQFNEITVKPELTSPVRYYTDGKPYVQIGSIELRDHPVSEACATLDRYEKYVIPHLQSKLTESQRREQAAVEDMKIIADTYREKNCDDGICGLCKFDADHGLDGDANECPGFETDDCFEWRGPQEAEKGEAK